VEFGAPTKAGIFGFKIILERPGGFSDGERFKSLQIQVNIDPNPPVNDTAVNKTTKIKNAFDAVINALPADDQRYIKVHQVTTGGQLTNELIIYNGTGAKIIGKGVYKDSTGELDKWSKTKDLRDHPDWPFAAASHLDDPQLAESLTERASFAYDLSGTPTGGYIVVEVNDEEFIWLDTSPYVGDPLGGFLIELDLCFLLNQHPLIEAGIRQSLLSPEMDDEENPFDGVAIEIVSLELYSDDSLVNIGMGCVDDGLVLRTEMRHAYGEIPTGSRYCEPTTNSTGLPAYLWLLSDGDLTDGVLSMEVDNVPDQFGIFFAGTNQIHVPFGNGYRCVGGDVIRLTAPELAVGNQASGEVDLAHLTPELATELNVQYWYRDPGAGVANFNLSDAVNVVR